MGLKRQHDNEILELSIPRGLKRQKICPDHCTIAWICALHTERTVAEATLDEVHRDLPQPLHDSNTYTLGSIEQHNIVIACLPEYGPVKANSVITHLIRTFPSIRLALMVGIGGGVPSATADVRLGDIVVGTRVVSYDLSKVIRDGKIERTGAVMHVHNRIGTAVSTLRSKHDLNGSKVQSILEERMAGNPEYSHPNLPDRFFQAAYSHKEASAMTCDGCDSSRIVRRRERSTNTPKVQYGPIASGHQVIKDGITRDDYARSRTGIMCFEVEAAGLMDELPCLPIRGICDYCDTHKNKSWQRYAAAVAGGYARELVEVLPVNEGSTKAVMPIQMGTNVGRSESHISQSDRRKRLFESCSLIRLILAKHPSKPLTARHAGGFFSSHYIDSGLTINRSHTIAVSSGYAASLVRESPPS
jgi:nucleoside phosphorylase